MPDRPVHYARVIPDVLDALGKVHVRIDSHGLERSLQHLVQIRASQINASADCVRMQTREAVEDGECVARLARLQSWAEVADFSERERAALAWTEQLTRVDRDGDYAALRVRLRAHFGETEIAALTTTVAMINLWNRIRLSAR